jgi:hypothetical protein
MRCVEAELRARGLAYELCEGGAALRDPPVVIGLVNLAQQCHATVPPRWPELVRFLLDGIVALPEDEAIVRARVQSGEAGRVHLRVRLHPDDYFASVNRAELIMEPIAPGLAACLAWDLPTTVSLVRRSEIASWSVSDDTLFAVALANVRAREAVARAVVGREGATEIEQLSSEGHFAASHALSLEDHVGASPEDRVLVAVPSRHQVLFARLPPGGPPGPVLAAMRPLVARSFRNGPGSISPRVFSWKPRLAGAPSSWVSCDS